ncbi:TIGR03086 family metal-binding protein [Mycobacterium asiaticum]|uniref:TIGR03086 family metal-binding protein n=1 Tax=Mycobacterium asiaticum TaxID=1790 RepID=UPI001FD61650|nr:TIGR03086 family metal-binding protein [Mycobacterium asiaticum]
MSAEVRERLLAVCRRFGEAVRAADGHWDRPSPCDAWDARGVVEHVIGFHDVLVLRPLGLQPDRSLDDPLRRWESMLERLCVAFERTDLFERTVKIPAVGNRSATQLDATNLVPRLTQDVLVHTWDLARAVDADDHLDPEWCAAFLDELPPDADALSDPKLFAPPVWVGAGADVQSRLLGRLGRDPCWRSSD